MSMYSIQWRTYRSAGRLARGTLNLCRAVVREDDRYFLTDEEKKVVVVVDCSAPIGPASGKSARKIVFNPHPWAQEAADIVWNDLDWDEVSEDAKAPGQKCSEIGWTLWIPDRVDWSA